MGRCNDKKIVAKSINTNFYKLNDKHSHTIYSIKINQQIVHLRDIFLWLQKWAKWEWKNHIFFKKIWINIISSRKNSIYQICKWQILNSYTYFEKKNYNIDIYQMKTFGFKFEYRLTRCMQWSFFYLEREFFSRVPYTNVEG